MILLWYNNGMPADWIKEWAIVIGAGATFILATVAFWAIWQNYTFRKVDRKRELIVRASNELCRWTDEALRLFYLPYNRNEKEIYEGLLEIANQALASTSAGIILGKEFEGLVRRVITALVKYFGAIKERRKGNTGPIEESILEEYKTSFNGLQLYLNLLRTWDYDYASFIKDACKNVELPLNEHLQTFED